MGDIENMSAVGFLWAPAMRSNMRPWQLVIVGIVLLAAMPCSAIPPLTDEQQGRLETAHDGRDFREEAFLAIVENVRQWGREIGDVPVRMHPDFDAILDDPDQHRGDLVRLRGVMAQQTKHDTDAAHVREWFLRSADGRPIIVYVVPPDELADAADDAESLVRFRDGDEVVLYARFYKRMTFTARDGEQRDYPAFVGTWPRRIGTPTGAGANIAIILLPLIVLLVLFLLLMAFVRRQKSQTRPRSRPWTEEELAALDELGPLPDDPAEALKELKRRAEQT